MSILTKIENLIKAKGINKKIFLEAMELNKSTWGDWERGSSSGYYKILDKIAEYLGVSTDYLFGITEKPAPPDITPEEALKIYLKHTAGKDLTDSDYRRAARILEASFENEE
jgi:transcriptional regulator with XRE-family HTH domain